MRRHYEKAAEEQPFKDKALALIQTRADARDLARQHPDASWEADSDVSLVAHDYPLYCPGEYMVSLQLAPHVDHVTDPTWFVDIRTGGTRRGVPEARVEEAIARASSAPDAEHHFPRAYKCLNGKMAIVLPQDAIDADQQDEN
jgi:hypothetical protein